MAAARLRVSVATPDGVNAATRGLGPWLARIAPAAAKGDLSIAIVSDRRMRALNRQFRGKDKVTDVLSFPAESRGFLGDIVIAAGASKRQAQDAGHTAQTEVRVLALHGLLHLLGYDHEADDGRMARAEARLRRKAGLPEGLIERGHGRT
jgi:probable rRNA maturation factor